MKKLVIAEKPSVARDLARVLGKVSKKEDYFENDEWVIDSAVGHLVELYMPDDFDPKLKSWKISNLPIIPPSFELKPISTNKKKFQQLFIPRLLCMVSLNLETNQLLHIWHQLI